MIRIFLLTSLSLILAVGVSFAQGFGPGDGSGTCNFVDEDGDGFNDLAPDHDGDGIPNGLDPDWVKPEDGTGLQNKYQWGKNSDAESMKGFGQGLGFVHMYSYMHSYKGDNGSQGAGNGPGDGTGFGPGDGSGVGPADGTGFGPGDGSGECDGTGSEDGGSSQNGRGGRR